MYVFFVVQAVLAALHAAVAQAPFFQLACPGAGFIVGSHHIVKCTVRGQNVTGAGCLTPVSSVKLETVNSLVTDTIGYSIYPTCETSWSHSGNDNGRCVAIDANNIYTFEFNVTGDRAILTNDTGLRCHANCATGPGLPNPLTYNSSESCGPPVKFVEQTTTASPSTSEQTTTASPSTSEQTTAAPPSTSGVSQNSNIKCLLPFYEEGSSDLSLTIDSSTFGGCHIGPRAVTCTWYPETGTPSVVCIQSVISCDQAMTNLGCRCDSVNGKIYKYSLSFSMYPGEEKGNMSCSLDCKVPRGRTGPKATIDSDQTCQNINFVSKCFKNGQCKRGTCRINKNKDDVCDCTGTGYAGTSCENMEPFLIALICVSTLVGLLMSANCAGVYCAWKQRSGAQQNAPPADAPRASAFLANAAPVNAPPDNAPPDNAPPDNAPQVAGSAWPSTVQTFLTTPYEEPGQSSVASSEASESTAYSTSEVSDV